MADDLEFIGLCSALINDFLKKNMNVELEEKDLKILSLNTLTDLYHTFILHKPTNLIFEILGTTNLKEQWKVNIFEQIGNMSAHIEKDNSDIHLEGDC